MYTQFWVCINIRNTDKKHLIAMATGKEKIAIATGNEKVTMAPETKTVHVHYGLNRQTVGP